MNSNKKRKLIKDLRINLLQVGDKIEVFKKSLIFDFCSYTIVEIYKNNIHLSNGFYKIKLPKSQIIIRNNNLYFQKKYTIIR